MDAILAAMNAVFLAFIVSTMFSVGLGTRWAQLRTVLTDARWLIGALAASVVFVPVLGWILAEAFQLEGAGFVALVLVASSPGAPFAVSLTQMQKGDVLAGAATMAILAVIGSFTTPVTADLIIGSSDVAAAGGGSIDTGQLVLSIVALQIVPFAIGMTVRQWAHGMADAWLPPAKKTSSVTFGLVMLAVVIGGFSQVVDLVGSRIILAAVVLAMLAIGVGALLSPAPRGRRETAGLLASSRNAGPVLLIATASFADVQGVIPATIAVFIPVLATQVVAAAWMGRRAESPEEAPSGF